MPQSNLFPGLGSQQYAVWANRPILSKAHLFSSFLHQNAQPSPPVVWPMHPILTSTRAFNCNRLVEKPTASSIAFRHQQEWVSYRGSYGDVYFKIEVLLFSKRDLCFNSIKAWFIISGKLEVFQCCSVFCNNNSASQRLYFISNRVGSLKHSHPQVRRGSRKSRRVRGRWRHLQKGESCHVKNTILTGIVGELFDIDKIFSCTMAYPQQ